MLSIILIENEYVTLQYLPDKACLYHVVHKPYPDEELIKNVLNTGAAALTQYGICKWLSDDRKTGPMSPEFIQWGATEFNPRAIAAGWKYWANVVPEQVATAANIFTIMQGVFEMGLRMMVFTDTEKAVQWLDSMEC